MCTCIIKKICFFLRVLMKEKIRKFWDQNHAKDTTNSLHQYSYKNQIRKTLGSQQDASQKIPWNISVNNLSQYYSYPKNPNQSMDYQSLLQQNRMLREQIKALRAILVDSGAISKNYEKVDTTLKSRKDEKTQQIDKLKGIISKSLSSIEQMQKQINALKQQLSTTTRSLSRSQKKCKILQFEKQESERKITNITLLHRQELQVLYERIRKLDQRTQQLMQIIQQEQYNWSHHMQQLNNIKKFYLGRTYK